MAKKTNKSEVHAYKFILDELIDKKGWEKNQVYTQQECQKIKEIKEALGLKTPENIIKVSLTIYYVIESKNERKKLEQALKESKDYADKINKNKKVYSLFVTGIAGDDEEGFIGKSQYFDGKEWKTITENDVEITGLLSKNQIKKVLETKSNEIKDVEITEEEFLKSAEKINEILHENSINKDYRARFISAILLALSDGGSLDLDEDDVSVLISTINAKVYSILNKHGKKDFSRFIKIEEPSNTDNHIKVKTAIVKTIQELLGLNIRSAMNSGKDILGKFYEVFLKYGNGAKEIGIVLTPRHITRFSAEVLDIKTNDLVLDPACGTGGFLVSAYDEVRKKHPPKNEFDNFKEYGLYGVEDQDPVIALAIVNMIFRGDGKNNMIEGNCFNKWYNLESSNGKVYAKPYPENKKNRIPPITKVMMNPPFAQKSSKNKEYQFIEQALKQIQDDGILFSVLPISVLVEKSLSQWRKDLLKKNTLLSVITFPEELFYPTGVHTLGIFIKKGIPHQKEQNVLWIKISNDGFFKKKGKRLRNNKIEDDLVKIKDELKEFIKNQSIKINSVPEFKKARKINFLDSTLELVSEAYIDTKQYNNIDKEVIQLFREYIAFNVLHEDELNSIKKVKINNSLNKHNKIEILSELFEINYGQREYHNKENLDIGNNLLISSSGVDNGFYGFFDVPINFKYPLITVPSTGSIGKAFVQQFECCVDDNCLVLVPKKCLTIEEMYYIASLIRRESWRFKYGRQITPSKIGNLSIDFQKFNPHNLTKFIKGFGSILK